MSNTNLPAFPVEDSEWKPFNNGLTKREYFAAKALQGLIAHPTHYVGTTTMEYAKDAVKLADALLEVLKEDKDV